MKATLQGLLEEHIEMLLDNHEVLPEPNFRSIESLGVPTNANNVHSESFTVVVPSTADKYENSLSQRRSAWHLVCIVVQCTTYCRLIAVFLEMFNGLRKRGH